MYHNGKCYIWIPSALTLSFMTAETADFINQVHAAINEAVGSNYKKTDYTAGMQPHEYYLLMNDLDMGGAPFTRDVTPGMAVCGPIENLTYLSADYCSVIVAFFGDIEGLPVWFEFDDPTAICPFSNSDETWETWGTFGESHIPVQLGEKWYRSNAVGESGYLLDASQWVPLMASGAVTVKTRSEFTAIQEAAAQQ